MYIFVHTYPYYKTESMEDWKNARVEDWKTGRQEMHDGLTS